MNIDAEEFGRAVGQVIADAMKPLARRIAELELIVKGTSAADIDALADEICRDRLDG